MKDAAKEAMQSVVATSSEDAARARWNEIFKERSDQTFRFGALIFAGLAVLWYSLGSPERAMSHVVATIGAAFAWWLYRKESTTRRSSICYLACMLWAIMGDVVCSGMSSSPSLWVLPIFPMLAGHLLGSRYVIPVCVGMCGLIFSVHGLGWLDIKGIEPRLYPGEQYSILACMTLGYCRVAYYSRKTLEHSSTTIKEQSIELIDSKFKADRASIAKSTFLANMSQQVKTPLQGASQDARGLVQSVGPEDREYALPLRECTVRIEWIVSDIVDISRIESGSLPTQHTELDFDMIRDSTTLECAEFAEAAKVDISFHQRGEVPVVLGDPRLISRLVTILVLDAIFRARSNVEVEFRFLPEQAGLCSLQIHIRHDGLLEDVEGSEVVFGMRVQDDERDVPAKIGLGLSMADSLASYMGGGLDVAHDESVQDYQRVARISLPCQSDVSRAA